METVNKTLEQRGEFYGSYTVGSNEFAKILDSVKTIFKDKNGVEMSNSDLVHINYIIMKLVRLSATPNHLDSWHDIQGYAKLAELHYTNKGKENDTQN